jgi:type 1 glutamine amidotransferase
MSAKRILLILGGMYHDFEGFAAAMRLVIEGAGGALDATYDLDLLTQLDRSDYDLVMSYTSLSRHREGHEDTTPETLSDDQVHGLIHWVNTGGAFLAVHSATVSAVPNPDMALLLGGAFVSHPPQFSFMVYPMYRPHPITEGIEAFAVKDELYVQDYDAEDRVHMVALDRGVAYPMVWTRDQGQGRVAYVAMGHGPGVWRLPQYQQLILQAIAWLTSR